MRTAQLAHDLKFAGLPFFYSWPSAARITSYLQDADAAELSEGVFEQLIEDLASLPVTDVYLIAHSMGNRIVSKALRARIDKGKDIGKLRELLLAAPDINADLFRTVIAPRLAAMQGHADHGLCLIVGSCVEGIAGTASIHPRRRDQSRRVRVPAHRHDRCERRVVGDPGVRSLLHHG